MIELRVYVARRSRNLKRIISSYSHGKRSAKDGTQPAAKKEGAMGLVCIAHVGCEMNLKSIEPPRLRDVCTERRIEATAGKPAGSMKLTKSL